MKEKKSGGFGQKVGGVRIVPLVGKIIGIVIILLLLSNFASNFINLMMNRGELIKQMNQLLVKDLKELHVFSTTQHEIYAFNQDYEGAVDGMKASAIRELKGQRSCAFGVKPDGTVVFFASPTLAMEKFQDEDALAKLNASLKSGEEGTLLFQFQSQDFFGVYKYNPQWEMFIVRAEELGEFYQESWNIFKKIALVIILITAVCVILSVFLIRFILRYVKQITRSLMRMQEEQTIDLIDMDKAPNDDITYLGMSFNTLSSTISNLMSIFRKFVTQDLAIKAYREKDVKLEGAPRDLSILFSDIKGFTYMTEILGTDIINLLNMHYERAIFHVHENGGIVGSLIGDALLAVFGTLEEHSVNKAVASLRAGYEIQEVASALREEMTVRREEIMKRQGYLTSEEEKIYKAVLIEVGVGIDGGEVFYGTIGSSERMTNTVIGDNVNSSSRLEGLTRIYRVPVICSKYIKDEADDKTDDYEFVELDKVQVKGKTEGKLVYWPIQKKYFDDAFRKNVEYFSKGLKLYYDGDWPKAYKSFSQCKLPVAEVFQERTNNTSCPKGWNGIWTMTSK